MEALPCDAVRGAPDRDGAGGDGAQVDHRPHLQRLHLQLRVRRLHQIIPGEGPLQNRQGFGIFVNLCEE